MVLAVPVLVCVTVCVVLGAETEEVGVLVTKAVRLCVPLTVCAPDWLEVLVAVLEFVCAEVGVLEPVPLPVRVSDNVIEVEAVDVNEFDAVPVLVLVIAGVALSVLKAVRDGVSLGVPVEMGVTEAVPEPVEN